MRLIAFQGGQGGYRRQADKIKVDRFRSQTRGLGREERIGNETEGTTDDWEGSDLENKKKMAPFTLRRKKLGEFLKGVSSRGVSLRV